MNPNLYRICKYLVTFVTIVVVNDTEMRHGP